MIHLGLIGYPLEHSLSPQIHSAALRNCGLHGDYSLFSIHPGDRQSLEQLLSRFRSGDIQGLNVTIPHKQNIIPFLDELTSAATAIGAVNTVYLKDNKLVGDNTDAVGFLSDLKRFLDKEAGNHSHSRALIFGAGGSARAVAYALLNDGWRVTLAARRPEQADQLRRSFASQEIRITDDQLSNIELSNIALIVNTTPLGMVPNTEGSPWPEKRRFPPDTAIYDLVYNPPVTKLVREARRQGLPATTGLGMLIEQAALSFKIWTGHNPSREIMHASVASPQVSNYQSFITPYGAS